MQVPRLSMLILCNNQLCGTCAMFWCQLFLTSSSESVFGSSQKIVGTLLLNPQAGCYGLAVPLCCCRAADHDDHLCAHRLWAVASSGIPAGTRRAPEPGGIRWVSLAQVILFTFLLKLLAGAWACAAEED